jgi:hypothetical protein
VALLQTLLSILQRELLQFEQQRNSRSAEVASAEVKPVESIDDEIANVVNEVLADADGANGTQTT